MKTWPRWGISAFFFMVNALVVLVSARTGGFWIGLIPSQVLFTVLAVAIGRRAAWPVFLGNALGFLAGYLTYLLSDSASHNLWPIELVAVVALFLALQFPYLLIFGFFVRSHDD